MLKPPPNTCNVHCLAHNILNIYIYTLANVSINNSLSIILGEYWQFLILASRKGVCGYIRMIVDGISLVLIHGLIVDFVFF